MDFINNWWDVLIFAILSAIHIFANVGSWRNIKSNQTLQCSLQDLPQKELGATIMNGAISAGITAVSILIPASLLIVQLGFGASGKPLPFGVLDNVFRASLWFLGSLVLGLYLIFISGAQSQFRNVATNLQLMIVFGLQLITLIVGVGRLVVGIHTAIYR